jgi:prolyl 4-hydroxylase
MTLTFRLEKLLVTGMMMFLSIKAEAVYEREDYSSDFYQLCQSPAIYVCENFLSDQECNHIMVLAQPYLARSTIVDPKSSEDLTDYHRTSQGMWIEEEFSDPIVKSIQRRIARTTEIPEQHCEDIQVLHYDLGGEYQPHYDYFDINTPGGLFHLNRGGQRMATFMIYLSDTEEGGETIFPKADIKIQPQKGKAVMFFNVDLNGKEDPMSLHGGAPVLKGEKWIMTRWIRSGVFH